jgi:hypothetical protein
MKFFKWVLFVTSVSFASMSFCKEIGLVMILRGSASVTSNSKTIPLKTAIKISEGDQIETAAQSYVKIVMNDRNIIVVTENSKMKITEYKSEVDHKKVSINLEYGSLRHKLEQKYKNKDEVYEVKLATSVSGVRGTDFLTEYNKETGDTVLCTLEGKVSFDLLKDGKPTEKPLMVGAGDFIRFKKTDTVATVIQAKKPWLDKALKLHSLE